MAMSSQFSAAARHNAVSLTSTKVVNKRDVIPQKVIDVTTRESCPVERVWQFIRICGPTLTSPSSDVAAYSDTVTKMGTACSAIAAIPMERTRHESNTTEPKYPSAHAATITSRSSCTKTIGISA
eukprot:CAMPEP_0180790302 /NCGR_PEP_ID=MMETSP1038_2-20121128/53142_1 /TAXON_ID=632150 /ORGANISM="Azadinium spinosum, Strain 3D9" /LENGTH=124 /DNA_ID=CAMNT_0022828243 /DNA_START=110 /DNA_END=484 /DNA_ORIENTATION=-